PAAARPSVIQLVFRERGALYAAYMPMFSDGGIFVPTTRDYKLGEDIYLLLSLPDDPQRYPVAGKVGWITPANASGGRTQGVGVLWCSAGVHPDEEGSREPTVEALVALAALPKVVAIGETGLDYYRLGERGPEDVAWQRERFRVHIRAARASGRPLVIHTRS